MLKYVREILDVSECYCPGDANNKNANQRAMLLSSKCLNLGRA